MPPDREVHNIRLRPSLRQHLAPDQGGRIFAVAHSSSHV